MVFLDNKMIFLLPPKCGTSSFVSLLKDSPKFDSDLIKKQDKGRHMHLSHMLRKFDINLQDFKIYQLCRHPLNRLISSFYYHRTVISKDTNNPFSIITEYNKTYKFNEFLELVLPIIISNKSKKGINAFVSWNRTIAKDFQVDHMFYKPQIGWNDLNINIEYLKLEDLMQDTSKLFPILGEDTPKKYPLKNNNKKPEKPKIPILEIFTKQTLELSYEAYEQDFKILGYK